MREQKNRRILASADRRARPRLADPRAALWRRALALGLAFGLSLSGAAWAVDVTDVRVGQHPGFTRVVFELDDAAGYQISREENPKEGPGLWVELDARTQPAQFSFNYGMVKSLDVKRHDGRLMAQVALRKQGLRFREMTLIDPFRVVIDVMAPVAPAAKKKSPVAAKPKPESKPAVEVAAAKTAAKVAAPAKAPQAAAAPGASAPGRAPVPAAKGAANKDLAKAATSPDTAKAPRAEARPPQVAAKPPAPNRTPVVAAVKSGDAAKVPPVTGAAAQPGASKKPNEASAAGTPAKRKTPDIPRVRKPQAPLPTPAVEEPEEGRLAWLLVAGLLVLVLGGGTALAVSRRRGRESFEESDFDEAEPEASESPFRALEANAQSETVESALFASELSDPEIPQEETVELDPPVDTVPESYPVLEGVPVEAPEDVGIEPAQAALSEDLARVLKEVENRLSALEGQLSEFAEWKASVETRITAQTEELRVQRAAIARTQRAVRQLSRPQEVASEAAPEALPTASDDNEETA